MSGRPSSIGPQPATSGVSTPTGPTRRAPPGAPMGACRPGSTPSKKARLSSMNSAASSGTRRSWEMASTGHTGSHAPQSMHSRGLM